MVNNLYLVHHGVKGMKWGIRRYQNPDGSLTSEGIRKYGTVSKLERANRRKRNARKVAIGLGIAAAIIGGSIAAKNPDFLKTLTAANRTNILNSGKKTVEKILSQSFNGIKKNKLTVLDGGKKIDPVSKMNFDYNKGEFMLGSDKPEIVKKTISSGEKAVKKISETKTKTSIGKINLTLDKSGSDDILFKLKRQSSELTKEANRTNGKTQSPDKIVEELLKKNSEAIYDWEKMFK